MRYTNCVLPLTPGIYRAVVTGLISLFCLFMFSCDSTSNQKPGDDRFTLEVLADSLDEPMGMAFLPGEKVLIVERKGALKMYDPASTTIKTIALLPVSTGIPLGGGYVQNVEEGLMGVIAHPEFEKNHWIFLYYADTAAQRHLLTRWEFINDRLVPGSGKTVLEVPINREVFKCSGGSMAFDRDGNLYLAVGTNTHYLEADTMQTPAGRIIVNTNEPETAGNTNDLRGKILRIHPNDDGTYSIPRGNLFSEADTLAHPEIYIMGVRNPWRISIDSKTGNLFWADPGRDDDKEDVAKNNGKGMDEFNVAKDPGNYGWPFFVGDNRPYYAPSATSSHAIDPDSVFNSSSRNTGWRHLPPARKSLIHYKYSVSDQFPLLGGGGRSAVGGPVFRQQDFKNAPRSFPAYYEGKWFVTDFIRGWIMAVSLDKSGNYRSMEQFLPGENFSSVLDMQFSPEGDLYVLSYGTGWYKHNSNARLVKISYHSGNRAPVAKIVAGKKYGAVPISFSLSGSPSADPDGDPLKYIWTITGDNFLKKDSGIDYRLVLERPGAYKVRLTVSDPSGASSVEEMEVYAGNDQPKVEIRLTDANETFYFPGDTIRYSISVQDAEDGSTADGSIPLASVQRAIDHYTLSYPSMSAMLSNEKNKAETLLTPGGIMINTSDCGSCHLPDGTSAGPSYVSIANRYGNKQGAVPMLAEKIVKGGSGNWGEQAMSAHPQLSVPDAELMVEHILSYYLPAKKEAIPMQGSHILQGVRSAGCIMLQAAYTDRGTQGMRPVRGFGAKILRSPKVDPQEAEIKKGMRVVVTPVREILMEGDGSYFGFRSIDLMGISKIELTVVADLWRDMAGGEVECRLDGLTGALIGKSGNLQASVEGEPIKVDFELKGKNLTGKHDIIFLFHRKGASSKKLLMELSSLQFVR